MTDNVETFNKITWRLQWPYTKKKQWIIYGANGRECSECLAQPGYACRNVTEVRVRGFDQARINTNPHGSRIDYARIFDGMVYRGYITVEERRNL